MSKIEKNLLKIIGLFIVVLVIRNITGCARISYIPEETTVSTQPATPQQCPNGGTQVVLGSITVILCNSTNHLQPPVCVVEEHDNDHDRK